MKEINLNDYKPTISYEVVSKDKIRQKIDELRVEEEKIQCSNMYGFAIEVLEELLKND